MAQLQSSEQEHRCGFVALVGRPNTGKSTLVNALVGQKISITADKPQTTRTNVRGIISRPTYQAVVVDTPGIHEPSSGLHKRIVSYALNQIEASDVILFITEPYFKNGKISDEDRVIIERLNSAQAKTLLLVNKIDACPAEAVFEFLSLIPKNFRFVEAFSISALKGKGLKALLDKLGIYLPAGRKLYPEDMVTDSSMQSIAGEMIRESVFRMTQKEIPYSVAVRIDSYQEFPGLTRIFASIIVSRDSQKGILIGKNGSMLKRLGRSARLKIQMMTLNTVYLDLVVKTMPDWYDNERKLSELGYESA